MRCGRRMQSKLTIRPVLVLHVELAETKVTKGNVTSVIQQDILWLQVAVDDIEAVQTLESAEQFGSIEAGAVDVETLLFLEVMEQLTTIDEG